MATAAVVVARRKDEENMDGVMMDGGANLLSAIESDIQSVIDKPSSTNPASFEQTSSQPLLSAIESDIQSVIGKPSSTNPASFEQTSSQPPPPSSRPPKRRLSTSPLANDSAMEKFLDSHVVETSGGNISFMSANEIRDKLIVQLEEFKAKKSGYFQLLYFVFFLFLYLGILLAESPSENNFMQYNFLQTRVLGSFFGKSDVVEANIYPWLQSLVGGIFIDAKCGDGVCSHSANDFPFVLGRGCIADCGKFKQTTKVHVIIKHYKLMQMSQEKGNTYYSIPTTEASMWGESSTAREPMQWNLCATIDQNRVCLFDASIREEQAEEDFPLEWGLMNDVKYGSYVARKRTITPNGRTWYSEFDTHHTHGTNHLSEFAEFDIDLPDGNWEFTVNSEVVSAGSYEVEISSASDGTLLHTTGKDRCLLQDDPLYTGANYPSTLKSSYTEMYRAIAKGGGDEQDGPGGDNGGGPDEGGGRPDQGGGQQQTGQQQTGQQQTGQQQTGQQQTGQQQTGQQQTQENSESNSNATSSAAQNNTPSTAQDNAQNSGNGGGRRLSGGEPQQPGPGPGPEPEPEPEPEPQELNPLMGISNNVTKSVCIRSLNQVVDDPHIGLLHYTCRYNYAYQDDMYARANSEGYYCPDSEIYPRDTSGRNLSDYKNMPCECLMPNALDYSKTYVTPPLERITFVLNQFQASATVANPALDPFPDEHATKKRFVGRHNRLMGGIMLHQTRQAINLCTQGTESVHLFDRSSPLHYENTNSFCRSNQETVQNSYGIDPVLLSTSILFDPTAAADQLSSGLYYDVEDRSLFDNTTGTPFMFHYDTHLHAYPVWLDANLKEERAKEWITMLKEGFFITPNTKQLNVMVPVFNPIENSFALTTVTLTWGNHGGVSVSDKTTIVNLGLDDDSLASGISKTAVRYYVSWVLLLCCVLFDVLGELKQMYTVSKEHNWNPLHYFKSIWNVLDWLNLIFFVQMISVKISLVSGVLEFRAKADARYDYYDDLNADANWLKLANHSAAKPGLDKHGHFGDQYVLDDNLNMYENLQTTANNFSLACLLCTLTMLLRFLKVLDFQPKLALISATISKAAVNLFYFGVIFGLMVFGFAVAGFIVFGKQSSFFSTLFKSWTTCFNLFLGDTSPDGTMPDNMQLGWKIYYYTFLMLTYFILLNILLAIIVDAYVEVKDAADGSAGVGSDLKKILSTLRCGKNTATPEELMQTLDPSRKSNSAKTNETSPKGLTAVLPTSVAKNDIAIKPKKETQKLKTISRNILVNNETSNGTVSFRVSAKFLQRVFGSSNSTGSVEDNEQRRQNIEEIFRILASEESSFEEDNMDEDGLDGGSVDEYGLRGDFAEVEKLAVKKRRSKQVLAYLVDKHLTRQRKCTITGSTGLESKQDEVTSNEARQAFDPF